MPSGKPVVCTYCNETIYRYTGPEDRISFKAEFFEPASTFPQPSPESTLSCPNCGEAWTAVSNQIDSLRMAINPATRGSGTVKY